LSLPYAGTADGGTPFFAFATWNFFSSFPSTQSFLSPEVFKLTLMTDGYFYFLMKEKKMSHNFTD